jgi:hypothetical protein
VGVAVTHLHKIITNETATGPFGARPNCGVWPSERCVLFIRGAKATSNWKERLTQQLLDRDLEEYLMKKDQWMTHSFNNICWKRNKTSSKRLSKARQASTAKICHNLSFTGAHHKLWCGEPNRASCADNMKTGDTFSRVNHWTLNR